MNLSISGKCSQHLHSNYKRPVTHQVIKWTAALVAACSVVACGNARREPAREYTPAEQRMRIKFGDIGYELSVDAIRGDRLQGVNFYSVGRPIPFYGAAIQIMESRAVMGHSGPIPERVRIVWRDSDRHGHDTVDGTTYNGKIIGDEVIEVGSRIPQDLINDLKRDSRGSLRLKFRMSRHGTMLGWDIERRPGYDPKKRDELGRPFYAHAVHSFAGGDFREAHIFNGKVTRPGWYIDRKTGRKIETDY